MNSDKRYMCDRCDGEGLTYSIAWEGDVPKRGESKPCLRCSGKGYLTELQESMRVRDVNERAWSQYKGNIRGVLI